MNRSIERIAALVEAYSVMLIVVLCTYILFVVFASTNVMELLTNSSMSISPILSYLIAFIIMPLMTGVFILIAHNMQSSAFPDLKDIYKKGLMIIVPACAVIGIFGFFPSLLEAVASGRITRDCNHMPCSFITSNGYTIPSNFKT